MWLILLSAWDWEPSIVVGCLAMLGIYAASVRFHFTKKSLYFAGGVLVLLLALVSPLDTLGDDYLFSAHMLQHLLLALVIPALLLLGIPAEVGKRVMAYRWTRVIERGIGRPPVSWIIGVGAMAVWHIPPLFNAALASEPLHIAQHLCFLLTGTIFWWPVLSPVEERRIPRVPWAAAYLVSACLGCTIIGVLITFARPGLYPAYFAPEDELGILPLIRNGWGITAAADQQAGGIIMWTVGCMIYFFSTIRMFILWLDNASAANESAQSPELAPARKTL
ncbi:MAG: cytochrome c oxidase assembly protein [Acidobacteria bacterium]|nr:cytochrome c oxidase assembly protein [Acidobacteriota bacterium]